MSRFDFCKDILGCLRAKIAGIKCFLQTPKLIFGDCTPARYPVECPLKDDRALAEAFLNLENIPIAN